MFDSNKIGQFLAIFGVVTLVSYIGTKVKDSFEKNTDEYEAIKKYLLNDSPLYGYNRPKIWIHSKYEINARKWKDFQSRNTTDLNQPYLHLTIKTIINHCGNDFNICLIDDETFSKLIPTWDIDLAKVAEPMKSHYREIGMLQLIYYYGGMILPNSFVCLKNLKSFYEENISENIPFVTEKVNDTLYLAKHHNRSAFVPSTFIMGAKKNDPIIKDFIEYCKQIYGNTHISCESNFVGYMNEWCVEALKRDKMNLVMAGKVGLKNTKMKPILLEDLMEEDYLDLFDGVVGIYIPSEEILRRPKYQWFAVLSSDEILKGKMIISKYLKASIVDSTDEYSKSTEIKSVVSI